MRNDFLPVHLMNANAKLDKHPLAPPKEQQIKKDKVQEKSLWKKFVSFLKATF